MAKGLYSKYIVLRKDGELAKGVFFVLKPSTDIHAKIAVHAYAESCRHEHPELSQDLINWLIKEEDND